MNKKLNKSLRAVCILALWVVLIVACMRAYNLYQYNKLHPQKEYSWNSFGSPPEEYVIKKEMMNGARNIIMLGVVIAIIWEVLLYFDDPKSHFVTYINKKIKPTLEKIGDKIDDDDDE